MTMYSRALLRSIRHAGSSAANWYEALSSRATWGHSAVSMPFPPCHSAAGRAWAMGRMDTLRHASTATASTAAASTACTAPAASAPAPAQAPAWPHVPISRGAEVLDGRRVAAQWVEELGIEVARVTQQIKRQPGLAVVLVGSRPDSLLYVTRKREACEKAGIHVDIHRYDEDVSQATLEQEVVRICANQMIDGVLIQLPLAPHLDEEAVMEKLDPKKDVDGFHPLNMGRMLMRGRCARLVPCTPLGIMELLQRSNVSIRGKSAVVVGDSNIVGTPLAALLRDRGASAVTVCHRNSYAEWCAGRADTQSAPERAAADACLPRLPRPSAPVAWASAVSQDGAQPCGRQSDSSTHQFLPAITRGADLLVVAVGHAEMVKASWVKQGAVVIDVGINVVGIPRPGQGAAEQQGLQEQSTCGCTETLGTSSSSQAPPQAAAAPHMFAPGTYHVVGDVAFPEVSEVASAITPVPGGVGPMTIAAVLHNTLKAARYNMGLLPW